LTASFELEAVSVIEVTFAGGPKFVVKVASKQSSFLSKAMIAYLFQHLFRRHAVGIS
jgi:hypothetical protein